MAYSFAIDYPNAKDRSRIFMWKVKELENERKEEKFKKILNREASMYLSKEFSYRGRYLYG